MKKHANLLLLLFCILILACGDNFAPDEEPFYPESDWEVISEDLELPRNPYNYRLSSLTSGRSLSFDRKATIGRVLFFDKSLSADGSVSCASCHKQELAFSDDVSFSTGAHGNLTTRNSFALGSFLSLSNEYYDRTFNVPGLFWDNRAPDVKAQMLETLANPNEMGIELDELVSIVKSKPYYQSLFDVVVDVPGEEYEITSDHILDCMQDFVSTINSSGSKFDKSPNRGGDFLYESADKGNFTDSEHRGKLLFSTNCNSCHVVSSFTVKTGRFTERRVNRRGMANNGLAKIYKDKGAGSRSEYRDSTKYYGLFKVPDLRNVALTGPYMHDGSINTLEDVISHYSNGIQDHNNLSDILKDELGNAKQFNFTDRQKADLLDFLHTLTDPTLITDEKWSDPFKK